MGSARARCDTSCPSNSAGTCRTNGRTSTTRMRYLVFFLFLSVLLFSLAVLSCLWIVSRSSVFSRCSPASREAHIALAYKLGSLRASIPLLARASAVGRLADDCGVFRAATRGGSVKLRTDPLGERVSVGFRDVPRYSERVVQSAYLLAGRIGEATTSSRLRSS
eukprot:TRINITY_DN26143_c0_g1_i2.p2 TRINITY_DN26143_c0_g1~~TRINITY_DN26143_c0_g1_i2.p2  ORF type:complete len:164 (+),score=12.71 TRINITY_DN26143_c0_g1_i2:80-571(+)